MNEEQKGFIGNRPHQPEQYSSGGCSEELPQDGGCPSMPMRETAYGVIGRRIAMLRNEVIGLEHLLKIAKNLENGSPGEVLLWDMVSSRKRHF